MNELFCPCGRTWEYFVTHEQTLVVIEGRTFAARTYFCPCGEAKILQEPYQPSRAQKPALMKLAQETRMRHVGRTEYAFVKVKAAFGA